MLCDLELCGSKFAVGRCCFMWHHVALDHGLQAAHAGSTCKQRMQASQLLWQRRRHCGAAAGICAGLLCVARWANTIDTWLSHIAIRNHRPKPHHVWLYRTAPVQARVAGVKYFAQEGVNVRHRMLGAEACVGYVVLGAAVGGLRSRQRRLRAVPISQDWYRLKIGEIRDEV